MVTFKPAVTLVALCSLLRPLHAVGDGSSTLLAQQGPEENSTGTSHFDVHVRKVRRYQISFLFAFT